MPRESYAALTYDRIRELDALTAFGPKGESFGQFINATPHGRAPYGGPDKFKSLEIEIDPAQLPKLASRVKQIRGDVHPEAAKYLK